jgi:spermidine synthase
LQRLPTAFGSVRYAEIMEWFSERTDNTIISHRLKQTLISTRSKYQTIDIVETYEFGRMLFLDRLAQSSELDEFIYHELLVHPAFFTHHPIETVCIIGGAEGATLREALRHEEVRRVVMIDIDEELVDLCRRYLPDWSAGAFEDPRLELRFMDGRTFLEGSAERFDAIFLDLSDPIEEGPSTSLYTKEFYELVRAHLVPGGCAALHAGPAGPRRASSHARIYNTLAGLFRFVRAYLYTCPSFHEQFSFALVSSSKDPAATDIRPLFEKKRLPLRCYSPLLHEGMFKLPAYLLQAYQTHTAAVSDSEAVYYPGCRRGPADSDPPGA